VLLAFWFATQLLVPQEGVATWAHAGGFLAGMATVLVLGGRNAILKDLKYDTISEFDED
jgi:membrane associated rhomboid family serine protease